MKKEVVKKAFSMPLTSPSYPKGPYRFINREYFIINYRTKKELLKQSVPEPLEVVDDIVKYEFIRMPDSSGLGDYTESGQVIPVEFNGEKGNYVHAMYLNSEPAILAGREIWGFPKKFAEPSLKIEDNLLVGKLYYGKTLIATGTMGFKYEALDLKPKVLEEPNFLLKIIPNVDGKPKICELVRYQLKDIKIKGAWKGPAALALYPHAAAPVNDLPVLETISAIHLIADLTLDYGSTVYDYL